MSLSIYTRSDSGLITYQGEQKGWTSVFHLLNYKGIDMTGEPETERLFGWPHSYVTWFQNPAHAGSTAIGIGG